MRKEIIIAIFAGITVGVIIAFGAWRANSAIKVDDKEKGITISDNKDEKQGPSDVSASSPQITLLNVENYDVATETPIKLTGITKPESIVVISGEGEDHTIKSDVNGSFEQELALVNGTNQVIFSVFDAQGQNVQTKLVIIYSPEFAEDLN